MLKTPEYDSHNLRFAMSTQFDFVCVACGLTDSSLAKNNLSNTACPGVRFADPGKPRSQPLRSALELIVALAEQEAYKATPGQQPCRHTEALNSIHNVASMALGTLSDE